MSLLLPDLSNKENYSTLKSLQNFAKVVTAYSRQFIPYNKLRKENTLKVSHKGLTTQSIPYCSNDYLVFFEMELDFHLQSLWVKVGEDERQIPFSDTSETELYFKTKELLNDLGFSLGVELNTFNGKEKNHLDSDALENYLKALHFAAYSLKLFRSELKEQMSSLQFRPQEMDLILNLYEIERKKRKKQQHKTKIERIIFGFSLGNDRLQEPYFYCSCIPFQDEKLNKLLIEGAEWVDEIQAIIKPYKVIKNVLSPLDELMDFFRSAKNQIEENFIMK